MNETKEYNIGDVVSIHSFAYEYPTYSSMRERMGLLNKRSYSDNQIKIAELLEYTIFDKQLHEYTSQGYVYGIRSNTNSYEFLIGAGGLKLIREYKHKKSSLSDIIDSDPEIEKEFKAAMKKVFDSAIKSDKAKQYWTGNNKSKYHK